MSLENHHEAKTGRQLYVMRHGERMDRIFPDWLKLAFADLDKYRPYDLNQPATLPQRSGGPQNFHSKAHLSKFFAMPFVSLKDKE